MSVRQDDCRHSRNVSRAALFQILCRDADEHDLPPRRRQRILKWMQRSPENVRAVLNMEALAQELDRLKLLDRSVQLAISKPRPRELPMLPRRAVLLGGAAAVALPLSFLISTNRHSGEPIRHVKLEDGSVAHVLRGSEFEVEFSNARRLIHLTRGEAVFDVAKDADRPFIVRSPISDSIAVGTRFGVVADRDVTTITVSEGVVSVVSRTGANAASGTTVRAGQEFRVVARATQPQSVTSVNAKRKISWADGWLEFKGETIGEAVRTFNRFTNVQIKISQPELSGTRVAYGRFDLDKPESFARSVGAVLEVPVTPDAKRHVIYIGDR
jgi:transmembrane sensor